MKIIDLTNQTFGRLTVLRSSGKSSIGEIMWLCECDCGNQITRPGSMLRRGQTKSCGCFRRERFFKHGHAHSSDQSRTYHSWSGMRARCYYPKHKDFSNYGGRGIKVCERWNDFNNFLADMGERPHACTIDRIDSNGDYTPTNCRWATSSDQRKNQRRNQAG